MNSQNYYALDLYQKFSPTLRKFFILHCPDEIIKFFCDCIFNVTFNVTTVVKGRVKLENNIQRNMAVLSREKANIEKICTKKRVSLKRKRQVLGSDRGMRLLKLVIPSVLNHLKNCHDSKQ